MNESDIGRCILQENEDESSLSKPTRKLLFNLLCDYVLDKFDDPLADDVKLICREVVDIFPCLKHSPSVIGGIVISTFSLLLLIYIRWIFIQVLHLFRQDMLYNSAANSGFLLNTLRYRMRKEKPYDHASSEVPTDEMNELSLNGSPLSEDERNNLLIFFRSCNLRTEKDQLIDKMKKTIDFRREVLRDEKTQIMQSFPFYFDDPKLVCWARVKR